MQFSYAFLALAAITSILAQTAAFDVVTKPDPTKPGSETLVAGKPYTIEWTPSKEAPLNGKINILLLQGKSNISLNVAPEPVATAIEGSLGTYTWTPPTTLTSFPTYGFELVLVSNSSISQYSTFFAISGLSGSTDSTPSSSSSGSGSGSATATGTSTTATTVPGTTVTTTSSGSSTTGGALSNSTFTTGSPTGSVTRGSSTTGASTTATPNAAPSAIGGAGIAGVVAIAFGLLM